MPMGAKERREAKGTLAALQDRVARNVMSYLAGSKYDGPYEIRRDRLLRIKIDTGYGCPKLYLYFDWRIRISIYWTDVTETTAHGIRYVFSGEGADGDPELPGDQDDYAYAATLFLRELIRHVASFRGQSMIEMQNWDVRGFPRGCPERFRPYATLYCNVLWYPYSYADREVLDYITGCFRNKAFRRGRGDFGEAYDPERALSRPEFLERFFAVRDLLYARNEERRTGSIG